MSDGANTALSDLKALGEITSGCYKVSNRMWLALVTVSVLVLAPRPIADDKVSLPLGLGDVSPEAFYLVALPLLVSVSIAFAAAHAQAFLVQRLSMMSLASLIESMGKNPSVLGVHPKDLFDALHHPTMNRVAPLSMIWRGPFAFATSGGQVPTWRKVLSGAHYAVLKAVTFVVYYFVPALALRKLVIVTPVGEKWELAASIAVLVAILSIGQVAYLEIQHVVRVLALDFGATAVSVEDAA